MASNPGTREDHTREPVSVVGVRLMGVADSADAEVTWQRVSREGRAPAQGF